ncbi:MAG: flagellar assembly protein FliW [bacterium]
MIVNTSRFGEIEVREEELFTAVHTVPGFPNSTHYFFIERKNIAPFKWMQSVEEQDLTFVVVEPHHFFHDYTLHLSTFDLEELGIRRGEEIYLLVIVVLPEDLTKMTANLRGPLVFNLKDRCFKQVFVEGEKYTVRESILEGIRRKEEAKIKEIGEKTEAQES